MNGFVTLLPNTPSWYARDITSFSLYFLAITQRW